MGTIFSFISVASLFSPLIGGILYSKTGYTGVFGLGVGIVAIDFVLRILMVEKVSEIILEGQEPWLRRV